MRFLAPPNPHPTRPQPPTPSPAPPPPTPRPHPRAPPCTPTPNQMARTQPPQPEDPLPKATPRPREFDGGGSPGSAGGWERPLRGAEPPGTRKSAGYGLRTRRFGRGERDVVPARPRATGGTCMRAAGRNPGGGLRGAPGRESR
ncbi:hypothetical protein D3X13_06980 [Streptomyces fradiae]|nr:hypothetical protein D3X13_06980 [Streptomyces fradiae]